MMLFLVIERFRDGNAAPVYARFRAHGRLAPADVEYINSWVTHDLTTCYQVMAAPSRERLDEWIAAWSDLVEFEVIPVLTSTEASERAGPGQR